MPLPLQRFRLQNFKAVRDSGPLEFTPLTVFIGDNGSGKSSVLEGLETLRCFTEDDLDSVFQSKWKSFEHVWNKATPHPLGPPNNAGVQLAQKSMSFHIEGEYERKSHLIESKITRDEKQQIRFSGETIVFRNTFRTYRDAAGKVQQSNNISERTTITKAPEGVSLLALGFDCGLHRWQFLNLEPSRMGEPTSRRQSTGSRKLLADGSNLADYLQDILFKDGEAFNRLVSSLMQILPYARDIQVTEYSKVDQKVYLELAEGKFRVPGWMLSSGSLRLTAILACLYHPEPPPVLAIEEIENGLDPRTIGFLVSQIQEAVEDGTRQVIITTHSEYLLNLLSLQQIILVKRDVDGQPRFWRPGDSEKLKEWTREFAPGSLYTKGDLHREMPLT